MKNETKKQERTKRHARITAKVQGTKKCPRLVVFRSHQHVYAQLINDETGSVLASASDLKLGGKTKMKKMELAKEVGKLLAGKASKIQISKVVFDRGGYKYHGNIKALAEGAREGGLQF